VGRPSKYDPAYCDQVIELGKQGMSVVEIACELGVHRETIEKNWPENYPDFSEAFARARDESQAWWEKAGREGLTKDKFNAQVWSRSMSARFPKDWRETKLLGSDPDNPLPAGFQVLFEKPDAESSEG
jgi:hypothetical protein